MAITTVQAIGDDGISGCIGHCVSYRCSGAGTILLTAVMMDGNDGNSDDGNDGIGDIAVVATVLAVMLYTRFSNVINDDDYDAFSDLVTNISDLWSPLVVS